MNLTTDSTQFTTDSSQGTTDATAARTDIIALSYVSVVETGEASVLAVIGAESAEQTVEFGGSTLLNITVLQAASLSVPVLVGTPKIAQITTADGLMVEVEYGLARSFVGHIRPPSLNQVVVYGGAHFTQRISTVSVETMVGYGAASFVAVQNIQAESAISAFSINGGSVTFSDRVVRALDNGFASVQGDTIFYIDPPYIPPVKNAIRRPNTVVSGITARKRDFVFSDLQITPFIHPNTGDATRTFDDQAIRGALRNIILTNLDERRYDDSEFGTSISRQLFKPQDVATAVFIEEQIKSAVKTFEPRVRLDNVDVIYKQDNAVDVTLKYTILSAARRAELNLSLDRIR